MDQEIGPNQHTPPDQEAASDQKATRDQQAAPEQQQAASVQEPTSDQFQELALDKFQFIHPDDITPEGNEAYLHEHQRRLRFSYPSCDLSEVSYHTEYTDFAGSRHSSLNTEPLTLDVEQMHDVKDQAVDALQKVSPEKAFNMITKESLKTVLGRVSMMEYYWRHGQGSPGKNDELSPQESVAKALPAQRSTSIEKSQQGVEGNEQLSETKPLGALSNSVDDKTRPEDVGLPLEDDV